MILTILSILTIVGVGVKRALVIEDADFAFGRPHDTAVAIGDVASFCNKDFGHSLVLPAQLFGRLRIAQCAENPRVLLQGMKL